MDIISEDENKIYEIYIIKNVLNKKSYIGVAKKWIKGARNKYYLYGGYGRFKRHISNAFSSNVKNSNDCPDFYKAIRQFTSELFIYKILRIIDHDIKKYEEKYILKFNTHDPEFGYNILISTKKPICKNKLLEFTKNKENGNKKRSMNGVLKKKEHSIKLPPNINYRCIKDKENNIIHQGYFVQIKTNGILKNKAFLSDKYTLDEKLQMAKAYLEKLKVLFNEMGNPQPSS